MELKGRLCRLMCRLLRQISTAIFRSSPQNALSVWFKLDVFHGDYDTHVGVGVCVCVVCVWCVCVCAYSVYSTFGCRPLFTSSGIHWGSYTMACYSQFRFKSSQESGRRRRCLHKNSLHLVCDRINAAL